MKFLMISNLLPLTLLLGASVNAKKLAAPVALQQRAIYIGGWPLALQASQDTGCPAYAPVTCQGTYTNLECCPSGQTSFVNANFNQYCCPSSNDCYEVIKNYPACANATWIMYQDGGEYFCCEPGQIASTEGGYGLCEPAGVAVPPNLLAATISQDTMAAPSTTIATTETETAVTGTATDTATATAGVVSTTTAATGATSTVVSSSASKNTTVVMPSSQTSAVGTTMATTGSPAAGSPSGSASASASVSAKTGTSVGASNGPTAVGAVFALCFAVGVAVLMG